MYLSSIELESRSTPAKVLFRQMWVCVKQEGMAAAAAIRSVLGVFACSLVKQRERVSLIVSVIYSGKNNGAGKVSMHIV